MSPNLVEHFSTLPDPRIDRHKKHEFIDLIVLSISAVISGAEGWKDIVDLGPSKLDWLRQFVPLKKGIPVDDTIARVISSCVLCDFNDFALYVR